MYDKTEPLDEPAEVVMAGSKLYISNFYKPINAEFTISADNKPSNESVINAP